MPFLAPAAAAGAAGAGTAAAGAGAAAAGAGAAGTAAGLGAAGTAGTAGAASMPGIFSAFPAATAAPTSAAGMTFSSGLVGGSGAGLGGAGAAAGQIYSPAQLAAIRGEGPMLTQSVGGGSSSAAAPSSFAGGPSALPPLGSSNVIPLTNTGPLGGLGSFTPLNSGSPLGGAGLFEPGIQASGLAGVGGAPSSGASGLTASFQNFMQQAKPYIEGYNQAKSIYDLVKPNGGLSTGDSKQISEGAGAIGGLAGLKLSDLPPDVQKALAALVK